MPKSNIKVLLLNVNRDGWHSGNMIYDMRAVQEACDTVIYGPGHPNYLNNDITKIVQQIYGNGKPDVIYSYFTPNEKVGDVYINHYKIPSHLHTFPVNFNSISGITKIFALSDFWARSRERYSAELNNSGFSHCFCCFAPPYSNPSDFFSFFDDNIQKQIKFIGYPRCIDTQCFKDYKLPKQYDVITVGSMIKFYPFRNLIHQELSSWNGKKLKLCMKYNETFKYKNYPHCGANFVHSDFVRENYAKAINQSKILASCGGKYHLLMNKVFESMACNTVYMGEKPYGEKELFLHENYNYISINKDDIVEKLSFYMDRPELLNRICENGFKMARERHSIEKRAEDFVRILKQL